MQGPILLSRLSPETSSWPPPVCGMFKVRHPALVAGILHTGKRKTPEPFVSIRGLSKPKVLDHFIPDWLLEYDVDS